MKAFWGSCMPTKNKTPSNQILKIQSSKIPTDLGYFPLEQGSKSESKGSKTQNSRSPNGCWCWFFLPSPAFGFRGPLGGGPAFASQSRSRGVQWMNSPVQGWQPSMPNVHNVRWFCCFDIWRLILLFNLNQVYFELITCIQFHCFVYISYFFSWFIAWSFDLYYALCLYPTGLFACVCLW